MEKPIIIRIDRAYGRLLVDTAIKAACGLLSRKDRICVRLGESPNQLVTKKAHGWEDQKESAQRIFKK